MGKRFQLRLIFFLMGVLISMPVIIMISSMNQRVPQYFLTSSACWKSTDPASFQCWIPTEMLESGGRFDCALRAAASGTGMVYLVLLDTTQIELALNLYEISFKRLKIENFLFVCADRTAADLMFVRGIECYGYPYPSEDTPAYEYGELSSVWRTHMKTKLVLSALLLGYAVLQLNVDVILMHDILKVINASKTGLLLPSDYRESPFAYYYAQPTDGVKELHIRALELHRKAPKARQSDQIMFLHALALMDENGHQLPIATFDPIRFPGRRQSIVDGKPCSTCVVIHSASSQTIESKVYRLKESKLWMLDYGYYSDRHRKYITYHHPIDFGKKSLEYELNALKNALFLGQLLNRTVILPKFSCGVCSNNNCSTSKQTCTLDAHVKMLPFDRYFSGKYRESVFLSHPLVPRRVKRSISKPILIKTEFMRLLASNFIQANTTKFQKPTLTFIPPNTIANTRPDDILRWFNRPPFRDLSILRFQVLYDVFKWPLPSWSLEFVTLEDKIKEALVTKTQVDDSGQGFNFMQDILAKFFSFFQLQSATSQ